MKITFEDKEQLITNPNIPRKNKVIADDVNEIKRAINDNDDNIEELDTIKADRTEIPTNLNQLSNADTKFVNETQLANSVQQETTARQQQDVELQNQIDAITSQSDVVDVVGTYQELMDYDTSTITENDIIKVLQDSTHDNATSYFRWSNDVWAYVGSEGPYYTKGETDERLNQKANQTSLDTTNQNLNTLAGRVGTNETDISGIKAEQTTQNRQIATLIADSGNKIELSVNSQTYILTATLKNKAGEILNSSQVDLPLEAMIVNAEYDSTTKELVLTLQNGNTLRVSLADIVSGLVSQDDFDDLEVRVDDLEDDVADIKEEQTTQNAEIEELQERVEILENTVNSELEDATATGESISVTDSANAPAKLLPSGNTYQVQYEGYNLVDVQNMTISGGSSQSTVLKVPIDANTDYYYYDVRNYSTTFNWGYIEEYDSEDNLTQTIRANANQRMDLTFLTGLNASYLKISSPVKYDFIIENPLENNIMLTKGTTKKALEPFVGGQPSPSPEYPQQIHVVKGHNEFKIANSDDTEFQTLELDLPEGMEMCKIGDYADAFEWQDGKWYKNHKLIKHEFTSGHSWPQETDNHYYWNFTPTPLHNKGYMKGYRYDSRFSGFNSMPNYHYGFEANGVFHIMNNNATSRGSMANLLINADEVLYYVAKTPTLEEITDQTLISQLDKMQKVLSYYGGTNITTITAEDLNPILNFDYKKSNRLRIEALENAVFNQ